MSKNEKTLNGAYLIVKGEGEKMEKVSYRTNLIEAFKDDMPYILKYSTLRQTQKD